MNLARIGVGVLAAGAVIVTGRALGVMQDDFDHWQHRAVFPTCVGCHAGAANPTLALWPAPGFSSAMPLLRRRVAARQTQVRRFCTTFAKK